MEKKKIQRVIDQVEHSPAGVEDPAPIWAGDLKTSASPRSPTNPYHAEPFAPFYREFSTLFRDLRQNKRVGKWLLFIGLVVLFNPVTWACDQQIEKCTDVCSCGNGKKQKPCPGGGDVTPVGGQGGGFHGDYSAMIAHFEKNKANLLELKKACNKKKDSAVKACSKPTPEQQKKLDKCKEQAEKRSEEIDDAIAANEQNQETTKEGAKKTGEEDKKEEQQQQQPQQQQPQQNSQPQQPKPDYAGFEPDTTPEPTATPIANAALSTSAVAPPPPARKSGDRRGLPTTAVADEISCSIDYTDCMSMTTVACGGDKAIEACCRLETGRVGKNASQCPKAIETLAEGESVVEQLGFDPGGFTGGGGGAGASAGAQSLAQMRRDDPGDRLQKKEDAKKSELPQVTAEGTGGGGGGGSSFSPSSYDDPDPYRNPSIPKPSQMVGNEMVSGQSAGAQGQIAGKTRNNFKAVSNVLCREYKNGSLIQTRGGQCSKY